MRSFRPLLIEPSRAAFYHIIWVQRGQATHTVDFQPVTIKAGSMLFISLQRVHTFDATADYEGQVLLFTDAFFTRNDADR